MKSQNKLVQKLLDDYAPIWALNHSMAVMTWDMETRMPEAGARPRGMASGQIALMMQKGITGMKGAVAKAEKSKDLDDRDRGVVRALAREMDYYVKVPPRLVDELQKVTTEGTVAWRSARKKSDFKAFQTYLQRTVDIEREVAEKLGYDKHPYDALLNLYEEGFTVRDADAVFARLIPGTKKVMDRVERAGTYPSKHPLDSAKYDTPSMQRVNEGIVSLLRMPKERFSMDVSTHPFTIGIAPDDVRITTRYEGVNFKGALFSTIHESGHALYELGIGEDIRYSPIGTGASLGIHESQSRFWENVVGRSREFSALVIPLLRKNLSFISRYTAQDLYLYFNTVGRSFIRVEADELSYNLHIALRYEIEKKVIAGDVKVSELPSVWNDTFDRYFGMRPPSDSEGVLQDIHWSGGSFGYFPTYSLGNVVLGMIWHKMGDGKLVRESISAGDITPLKEWLQSKMHRYGATYTPKQLQDMLFGEAYNPEWLLKYLERKFA